MSLKYYFKTTEQRRPMPMQKTTRLLSTVQHPMISMAKGHRGIFAGYQLTEKKVMLAMQNP